MKLTIDKFLELQDKSVLLQVQDDVFMDYRGEYVNNSLETIKPTIAVCDELEYKVVDHCGIIKYLDPLDEIMRFQTDRQLDKMPYDNHNETTLVLEEIFESFGFDVPKENRKALGNSFKQWMTSLHNNNTIVYDGSKVDEDGNVLWEESVDSTCDQIVFLVGKLMKLNVDPKLALLETSKEINSRLQDPTQKEDWELNGVNGKFQKWLNQPKQTLYKAQYFSAKVN